MSHGPEHHIEHAEHAAHASHDAFDRQVTISIAIVAAVLAFVTMMGHRSHNETLRLQGEALRLQTEGGVQYAQASDRWAQYQAYNIRSHLYLALIEQGELNAAFADRMEKRISSLAKQGSEDENDASQDAGESKAPDAAQSKQTSKPKNAIDWKTVRGRWEKQMNEYKKEKMPETKKLAEELTAKGEEDMKGASEYLEKSHAVHLRCDRLDFGELGLQLGVVLCSLSILTKRRGFWQLGLLCAVAGFLVALTGVFDLFLDAGHHVVDSGHKE